jgi:hypothetical protein
MSNDLSEYLTDLEIAKIQQFNDDIVMSEAIKKVMFSVINIRGGLVKGKKLEPLKNGALGLVALSGSGKAVVTDEYLGQDLRAYYYALQLLESSFMELQKLKLKKEEGTPTENPAI